MSFHVSLGIGEVQDRGDLAVQDGIPLIIVEALGQELAVLPVREGAPEGRIRVPVRALDGPPRVPLVIHVYLPMRCLSAPSSSE